MRLTGWVVAVAVALALLGGCSPDDGASADRVLSRDQLESVGIVVVASEADVTASPTALTFTEVQVERMVAEAGLGAGIAGRDLDAIAPMPPDLPPASYLLASYVSAGTLPGAVVARSLFPADTDWTRAPDVVFPVAVLALLVADLMAAAADDASFAEEAGALDGGTAATFTLVAAGAERGSLLPRATSGPCSLVTTFLSTTINGIFGVLRVLPGVIGGIKELGFFGTVLAGILNGAITLAQGVVEGLVATVVGPALAAVRLTIAALGVASVVLSYFTRERLKVTPAPGHTSFSIDPAPGNRGTFRATAEQLSAGWPPVLVDCARASGAALPELVGPGAATDWTLTTGTDLIALDSAQGIVGGDRSASMGFVTGHEDAETAKGPERTQAARVSVRIPRKEVGDFLDLAAKQMELAKAQILAPIPAFLHPAVQQVFASTIDPTVASIRASVQRAAGGVLSLDGQGSVYVTFHGPPDPDPTAPPAAPGEAGPDEFCRQFNERVDVAIVALDQLEAVSSFGDELFAWGEQFAQDLQTIDAVPPDDLAADFAMTVAFYDLMGGLDFAHAEPLYQFIEQNDIDGARNRLWLACDAATFDDLF